MNEGGRTQVNFLFHIKVWKIQLLLLRNLTRHYCACVTLPSPPTLYAKLRNMVPALSNATSIMQRSFFSSSCRLTFCPWRPLTNKTENYWLFRKHLMVLGRWLQILLVISVSHREASFKAFIKYKCSSWSCFTVFMKYSYLLERRWIACGACATAGTKVEKDKYWVNIT